MMQMYAPYIPPPRRPTPEEHACLHEDGNFVGGMLIILNILFAFLFTAVALALVRTGMLPAAAVQEEDLGLGNTRYLLLYGAVYTLTMGLPSLLGLLLFRRPLRPLVCVKRTPPASAAAVLLIGFGGCIAANFAASYLSAVLQQFGMPAPYSPDLLEPTPQSLLLNLAVMAVLPALLEELLVRVCILGTLRKYGDRFAVFMSALLFGLLHGSVVQSVFAFIVGLVLGWIAVTTGNIWLSVLLHCGNNALSVLLSYAQSVLPEWAYVPLSLLAFYGLLLAGFVTLIVIAVRRSPVLTMAPRGKLRAGACAAALWKTPLMVIATLLLLLRVVQMTFLE